MGDFQGHPFRGNQWTDGGYAFEASVSEEALREFAGRHGFRSATRSDFARAAGVAPGFTVRVEVREPDTVSVWAYKKLDPSQKSMKTDTTIHMNRFLNLKDRTIRNESFLIPEKLRGQGLATEALFQQAKAASALGFTEITVKAAGYGAGGKPVDTNGYYTWARLGFLPVHDVGAGGKSGLDLPKMMMTPEGRKWWANNGTAWNGRFDLRPGSVSMRVLSAYRDERGKR